MSLFSYLRLLMFFLLFLLSGCVTEVGTYYRANFPVINTPSFKLLQKESYATHYGKTLLCALNMDFKLYKVQADHYINWDDYQSSLGSNYGITRFNEKNVARCFSKGCGSDGEKTSLRLYILYYLIKNNNFVYYGDYKCGYNSIRDFEKGIFTRTSLTLLHDKNRFISEYEADYKKFDIPKLDISILDTELALAYQIIKPHAVHAEKVEAARKQAEIDRKIRIANMPERQEFKIKYNTTDPLVDKIVALINTQRFVFSDLDRNKGEYNVLSINSRKISAYVDVMNIPYTIFDDVLKCQNMQRYVKTRKLELNYCVLSYIKGIELWIKAVNDKGISDQDFEMAAYQAGHNLPYWAMLAYSRKRL